MTVEAARRSTVQAAEGKDPALRRSRLPEVALTTALGVFSIALAYASKRWGLGWGSYPYWTGELLLFLPALALLGRRHAIGRYEAAGTVTMLAAGSYLAKVCYSPTRLRYVDELEHWRTAQTILASHHLFGPNPSLPISPFYPGLENVTTAIVCITGLSVTIAGMVVAGLAQLLGTVGIFLLFESVLGSSPLNGWLSPTSTAGLAAALYATGPNFQFFQAMFIYEAPALAFAVVTLVAAVRLSVAQTRTGVLAWGFVGATSAAVVVVTHHVTSWALVGLLLTGVFGAAMSHHRVAALRLGLLSGAVVAGVFAWIGFVAPETVAYLEPSIRATATGFLHLITGHLGGGSAGGPSTSPSNGLLGYASAIVTIVGLLVGWRQLLRVRPFHHWAVGLAAAATTYGACLAVRVSAVDGTELASRSLTYVLIPVSFVLAAGFSVVRDSSTHPRLLGAAGLAMGTILVLGGLTGGWPPAWERLPQSYLPSAFESSISPQGTASALWAARYLGHNNRFGSDAGNYALISTIGWQSPVDGIAPLYYAPQWGAAQARLAGAIGVQYLLVDRRLATRLPPTGYYFFNDPLAGRLDRPIDLSALTKLDTVADINRLYDNGAIVIYGLPTPR